MNTEALASAPGQASAPAAAPHPVGLLKKADIALESTGRWILIVLYVFGLVFPFLGAVAAWVLL